MFSPSSSPLVDFGDIVRAYVHRAAQNSLYSVFREECTRHDNAVAETDLQTPRPSVMTAGSGLLFFPSKNSMTRVSSILPGSHIYPAAKSSKKELKFSSGRNPSECIAIIGAGGFMGKFIADQYIRRGINVSVLTGNLDYAKSIYIPSTNTKAGQRSKETKSLDLPSFYAYPKIASEVSYVDGYSEGRRMLRCEYACKAKSFLSIPSDVGQHDIFTERQVVLQIIEADLTSREDLEFVMTRAAVVYYLASLFCEPARHTRSWCCLRPPRAKEQDYYNGFAQALDVCRRMDAHFVALTPLWIHSSWISPLYWYYWLTSPPSYVRAVRRQEQILLNWDGTPPPCYYSVMEQDNTHGKTLKFFNAYRKWWNASKPRKLAEGDDAKLHESPVRFSLFRLSNVVYSSFNRCMIAAKTNCADDPGCGYPISLGNLDAQLFAAVLVKAVSLCSSVIGSRLDVAGQLRNGVDMKNTTKILKMFDQFPSERV